MMLICIGLRPDVADKLSGLQYTLKQLRAIGELSANDARTDDGKRVIVLDTDYIPDPFNAPKTVRELGFRGPIIGISDKPRDSIEYDDVATEITFMGTGGDRLLRAPFSCMLIRCVVEALLRRSAISVAEHVEEKTFDSGHCRLNKPRHTLLVGGKPVRLTAREFDILWAMGSRPEVYFSREKLADVLELPTYRDARVIDSHIKRLRQKIADAEKDYDPITTFYGVGYRVMK